jgi:hypothetical protein
MCPRALNALKHRVERIRLPPGFHYYEAVSFSARGRGVSMVGFEV